METNDFIIPSPCNNLRYGGIDYLEKAYNNLQKDNFGLFYLIEKQKFFFELILNNLIW